MFQIVSYGTRYEWLGEKQGSRQMLTYSDQNLQYALDQIKAMRDNFGGTEMYNPIRDFFERESSSK